MKSLTDLPNVKKHFVRFFWIHPSSSVSLLWVNGKWEMTLWILLPLIKSHYM